MLTFLKKKKNASLQIKMHAHIPQKKKNASLQIKMHAHIPQKKNASLQIKKN
jgi:hypothetical protein